MSNNMDKFQVVLSEDNQNGIPGCMSFIYDYRKFELIYSDGKTTSSFLGRGWEITEEQNEIPEGK